MEEKKHGSAKRVLIVILVLALVLVTGAFFLFGGRVQVQMPAVSGGYHYERAKEYRTLAEQPVEGLAPARVKLNWISGSVEITATDAEFVAISEDYDGADDALRLRWRMDGDTLIVQPCASGNLGGVSLPDKTLTVALPRGVAELEVDTVSAEVALTDVEAEIVELDTVSGTITGTGITAMETSADTTSGTVSLEFAALRKFEADTTSGDVKISFAQTPEKVELDAVSGTLTAALPEGSRYKLDWDTVSGVADASGYRAPSGKGGKTVKLSASTVSGSLWIQTN